MKFDTVYLLFFRFLLYFSALCDDTKQGKSLLRAAMNALLKIPISENAESSSEVQNENVEVKPALLWSAMYIQELTTVCFLVLLHIFNLIFHAILNLGSC